jgi:hypothetical protein
MKQFTPSEWGKIDSQSRKPGRTMLLHAPVLAALGARSTNIYTTSVMQMPFNRLVSDVFCIREPYNHADLNAIALTSTSLLPKVHGLIHYNLILLTRILYGL